jgi:hypothetical protein
MDYSKLSDIDWFDVIRILDPKMPDEEIEANIREMRTYAAEMRRRDALN